MVQRIDVEDVNSQILRMYDYLGTLNDKLDALVGSPDGIPEQTVAIALVRLQLAEDLIFKALDGVELF